MKQEHKETILEELFPFISKKCAIKSANIRDSKTLYTQISYRVFNNFDEIVYSLLCSKRAIRYGEDNRKSLKNIFFPKCTISEIEKLFIFLIERELDFSFFNNVVYSETPKLKIKNSKGAIKIYTICSSHIKFNHIRCSFLEERKFFSSEEFIKYFESEELV